jgi:hypothetical protein
MRVRGCFWLLVLLSSALAFPPAAHADTIRVTSGFFDFAAGGGRLVGERGFSVNVGVGSPNSPAFYVFCEGERCTPGTTAGIQHAWGGLDLPAGALTFDGVTYPEINTLGGPASLEIGFESHVTLPPLAATAILRTPFTFRGSLALTPESGPWVTHSLIGSGTLTSSWRPDESLGGNAWYPANLRYDFSAAAPIPEPTTMVLAGIAGAAAAFGRRRKRAP